MACPAGTVTSCVYFLLPGLISLAVLPRLCLTLINVVRRQTVAEQEAWKLAEQHGFDLVTIQPSFVIGPVLSRRQDATSIKTLKASFAHPVAHCSLPMSVSRPDAA